MNIIEIEENEYEAFLSHFQSDWGVGMFCTGQGYDESGYGDESEEE